MGANRTQGGFTIIEMVVAMVLFAAVSVTIANMIISVDYVSQTSRDYKIINGLAADKLESLRGLGFTNLADGTTNFTSELPGTLSPPNSGVYTVSTQSTNVKKITLTVSYTAQGDIKSYNFTTYISKNGLGQ